MTSLFSIFPSPRSRINTGVLLILIISLGLFSRTPAGMVPIIGKEIGDTLWAVMFYLWIVLFRPRLSVAITSIATIAITFLIEFLKLYHAPWFEAIRNNRVGGLLLGHTFYWHDLLCYLIGTALATAFDLRRLAGGTYPRHRAEKDSHECHE